MAVHCDSSRESCHCCTRKAPATSNATDPAVAPVHASFFEENREYLSGRHRFVLSVGDRQIQQEVTMRPLNIEVRNDFVAFDLDSFTDAEKERVTREKQEAGFEDRPKGIYFLRADTLLASERLPRFDESKLSLDPGGKKFFVSHRWQSPSHPDPEGMQLALLKEHANAHPDAHYWVDYSCLPQARLASDTKLFEKTLPKLTSLQSGASTLVIEDEQYGERLWCYVEHYFGVLFSQTNFGGKAREVQYLGARSWTERRLVEDVLCLREPEWDKLRVTKVTDIPFIKQNYRFLSNVVQFQLFHRFAEVFASLPGFEIYCLRWSRIQSAFGLSYSETLENIRALHRLFNWRMADIYEAKSLNKIAALLAHSDELDKFPIDQLRFSKYLVHTEQSVAYLAMLLAVIRQANRSQEKVRHLRTLYAKLVIMSMFR